MKYTLDERINIGRQVYTKELTRKEALLKYDICSSSIDEYMRLYQKSAGIPLKQSTHLSKASSPSQTVTLLSSSNPDIEAYMAMSKEELINELIRSKANELRAKKGYEVKGAGANKEFVSLNSRNSKS